MKLLLSKFQLFILSGIVICLIIFHTIPSLSNPIQDLPNPRQTNGGWVTDMAEVLTYETEQSLNSSISKFEQETTIEIAVVTVLNSHPFSSQKAFTKELFNTWSIGKRNSNNGLLLAIFIAERRVEIVTGSGLEKILPSAKLEAILNSTILPNLAKNDFNEATVVGVQSLISTLYDEILTLRKQRGVIEQFTYLFWQIFLTVMIAICFTIICLFFYLKKQKNRKVQLNSKEKISVNLATVTERGWGLFLDLILLKIIYFIVVLLTVQPYEASLILDNGKIPLPIAISLILGNLEAAFDFGFVTGWSSFGGSVLLYRIIAEGCLKCTFGQLLAGLRVIKADNSYLGVTLKRLRNLQKTEAKPIGFYRAFLRNLMMIVDGFFLYLIALIAINRSDKSQRLGDCLAQTVVISRQNNFLNSPTLKSAYRAGGSFGIHRIDTDFGGGVSDGGGAGSDF